MSACNGQACDVKSRDNPSTAAIDFDLGEDQTSVKYRNALALIKRSLDLYGPRGLAFSFNGGKDSTALLHLLLRAVRVWRAARGEPWDPAHGLCGMHTFFFLRDDEFPEVTAFVEACDAAHCLGVHFYTGGFKDGLERIISENPVKAIFLGTRRGDPNYYGQEFFCPSSDGWPPFMRVNAVLDWTYHDVWTFLRGAGAAYCSLYDRGYTSLGSVTNTSPNSALLKPDGTHAPAHMLADARLERAGREANAPRKQLSRAAGHMPTAAVVVIGDEILAGKVADENTAFVASRLYELGWRLRVAVVLPDDVDTVAREVKSLMSSSDVVITTGGLGPTVDDVTVEAVARAVSARVVRHAQLEESLRSYFGPQVTRAHLKMAEAPEGRTELVWYDLPHGRRSPFPVLRVDNTFILPGVPHLLREKWPAVAGCLTQLTAAAVAPFRNRVVRIGLSDETVIAEPLEAVTREFPDVCFGSYPVVEEADGAGILVSVEGKDSAQIEAAVERFRALLTAGRGGDGGPAAGSAGGVISVQRDVRRLSMRVVSSDGGASAGTVGNGDDMAA